MINLPMCLESIHATRGLHQQDMDRIEVENFHSRIRNRHSFGVCVRWLHICGIAK